MSVDHDEIIAARAIELIDTHWHWRRRTLDFMIGAVVGAITALGIHEGLF